MTKGTKIHNNENNEDTTLILESYGRKFHARIIQAAEDIKSNSYIIIWHCRDWLTIKED